MVNGLRDSCYETVLLVSRLRALITHAHKEPHVTRHLTANPSSAPAPRDLRERRVKKVMLNVDTIV